MSIYFFSIPAVDGATTQEDLRAFLRRHSVLAVEKHLVQNGAESFWAIAVTIADETNRQALVGEKNRGGKETRIDYREVLDDEAFKRFVHLRELRKQIALAPRQGNGKTPGRLVGRQREPLRTAPGSSLHGLRRISCLLNMLMIAPAAFACLRCRLVAATTPTP